MTNQEAQINTAILNQDISYQGMEMKNTRIVKETEMRRVVELKVLYNQLCANLPTSFMEW